MDMGNTLENGQAQEITEDKTERSFIRAKHREELRLRQPGAVGLYRSRFWVSRETTKRRQMIVGREQLCIELHYM
jgi:hypothetical protein